MTWRIQLVLVIHNHQPVGNFDDVFEKAFQDSYFPFLEVLEDYPEIAVSLHNSGSLLEWIVQRHPEYIEKVQTLVERGQIEVIGGPFFEPILSSIPRRDRIGQIETFSEYLHNLFGQPIRGIWVPERVWEPTFASDLVQAGVEYTLLDDSHFRTAGLTPEELYGYFLTEDDGHVLKILPGAERLRYTIPFRDPQETIDYLSRVAEQHMNPVIGFGDDGEKFGTWPGTKKHCYEDGWLRRFFDKLREHSDWIKAATMAHAFEHASPLATCYLPDCSYREMTEWVLPTEQQKALAAITKHGQDNSDWSDTEQFLRGGFWRNFRVKYPEANEMYSRMLQISNRLEELSSDQTMDGQFDRLDEARIELYRAQCNCAYWHGAFGGLYLPHLRNAIFHHLIAADNILEEVTGRSGRWVKIEADDFNCDLRKEIRISTDRLVAFLAPARGGHLYELDIRTTKHNVLATLNRQEEPYHDIVRNASQAYDSPDENCGSIHEKVRFKQPDLDKKLVYDNWPRKSLVDHFFDPSLSIDEFQQGHGEIGDFVEGVYKSVLRRAEDRVEVQMTRNGFCGPHPIAVTKTVGVSVSGGTALEISYELENLPPLVPIHFGVEMNFAGMAANADDRYFYDQQGSRLGQLQTILDLLDVNHIGLVDEWLGTDASIEFSQAASVWTIPIQSISQSEGGFELVHQSTAVVPHWEFLADDDGKWSVRISLKLDTSAAQARKLRDRTASSL